MLMVQNTCLIHVCWLVQKKLCVFDKEFLYYINYIKLINLLFLLKGGFFLKIILYTVYCHLKIQLLTFYFFFYLLYNKGIQTISHLLFNTWSIYKHKIMYKYIVVKNNIYLHLFGKEQKSLLNARFSTCF